MNVKQFRWTKDEGWSEPLVQQPHSDQTLALVFGSGDARDDRLVEELKAAYPGAVIFGASAAAEVMGTEVYQDSLVVAVLSFDKTKIVSASADLPHPDESGTVTEQVLSQLPKEGLRHVIYFVEGLNVDHPKIIKAIRDYLPPGVCLNGGFCSSFSRDYTALVTSDGWRRSAIGAVGLYGEALQVASACNGAGKPFGPERIVTKCKENVLLELDGAPALSIIREYMGVGPGEPLSTSAANTYHLVMRPEGESQAGVIRGLIQFNEEDSSIVLGGDLNVGDRAQLSRCSYETLIDTATYAGEELSSQNFPNPEFAFFVSCASRVFFLKQRAGEEVEEIRAPFSSELPLAGLYAFGELCPKEPGDNCSLHNETVNLTLFSES